MKARSHGTETPDAVSCEEQCIRRPVVFGIMLMHALAGKGEQYSRERTARNKGYMEMIQPCSMLCQLSPAALAALIKSIRIVGATTLLAELLCLPLLQEHP